MKRVQMAVIVYLMFQGITPVKALPRVVVVSTSQFASPAIPDLLHGAATASVVQQTLADHCGIETSSMQVLTDQNASYPPTKKNVERAIQTACNTAGAQDTIILYLCVHGVRTDDGQQLQLLTSDSDPRDLEATSVSASWIREQLEATQAAHKLVLLDTFYKGKRKTPNSIRAVDTVDFANSLLNAPDSAHASSTVLIASASQNQLSQPLQANADDAPSLFAYWIAKALSGHADRNRDQQISTREVYSFIAGNIENTSRLAGGEQQRQTPLLVNSRDANQRLLSVVPAEFRKSVREAAETLSWTLLAQSESQPRIAVMPFTTEFKKQELVNGPYGALSASGSKDVASALEGIFRKQRRPVKTVSGAELSKLLAELRFTVDDLRDNDRMTSLASRANVNAIVRGQIVGVDDKNRIVCVLQAMDAKGKELGTPVQTVAYASANSLAMSGKSFDTRLVHQKVRNELLAQSLTDDAAVMALPANEGRVVAETMHGMTRESHPLEDERFPYQVWLEVEGKRRPIEFKNGEAVVTVARHQPFEIHVENQSSDQVMMRLLVDGFNTLPQDGEAMPQVHLDDARPWILEPAFHARVPGFVKRTGTAGEYAEFLVVDASRSLASRRDFTEQLGLVTAAFYRPKSSRRGVGVTPGALKSADFVVRQGFVPGDLLGVIQIRYQDDANE